MTYTFAVEFRRFPLVRASVVIVTVRVLIDAACALVRRRRTRYMTQS